MKLAPRGGPRFPHPASLPVPSVGQRRRGNAQTGPTLTAIAIKSPLQKS